MRVNPVYDSDSMGCLKDLSKNYGIILTANAVEINDKVLGFEEAFSEEWTCLQIYFRKILINT